VTGVSGWSKPITDVSVLPGGRPPSILFLPCWWHVGPPSGLRAAPGTVPDSTTTTGSNWGRGACPARPSQLEPSWRPPASAEDLAWGSGGVALVVVDGVPCGVGRSGELHALRPAAG
jgi:hypothetical protein